MEGRQVGHDQVLDRLGGGGMGVVSHAVFAALAALIVAPALAVSQELLTAGDIVAIESPSPDARIAYGEAALQFGYLRLPEGRGPHPTIVFIHGGCWLSRYDIQHTGPAEQALADAGYAVWSIEYRRVGDEGGTWPGMFLDVGSGVDHLFELAHEYALDLDRVIVAGHSAGELRRLSADVEATVP